MLSVAFNPVSLSLSINDAFSFVHTRYAGMGSIRNSEINPELLRKESYELAECITFYVMSYELAEWVKAE